MHRPEFRFRRRWNLGFRNNRTIPLTWKNPQLFGVPYLWTRIPAVTRPLMYSCSAATSMISNIFASFSSNSLRTSIKAADLRISIRTPYAASSRETSNPSRACPDCDPACLAERWSEAYPSRVGPREPINPGPRSRAVVIGCGLTPVKNLFRLQLQNICPRCMSTTTSKGTDHRVTYKMNVYIKFNKKIYTSKN